MVYNVDFRVLSLALFKHSYHFGLEGTRRKSISALRQSVEVFRGHLLLALVWFLLHGTHFD